jgi:peptidoglycan-N-acetylglucosamine deacetylase
MLSIGIIHEFCLRQMGSMVLNFRLLMKPLDIKPDPSNPTINPKTPLIKIPLGDIGGQSRSSFKSIFILFAVLALLLAGYYGFQKWKPHRMTPVSMNTNIENQVETVSTSNNLPVQVIQPINPLSQPNQVLVTTNLLITTNFVGGIQNPLQTNSIAQPPSIPAVLMNPSHLPSGDSNAVQVVHFGSSEFKKIALTFDDGPHATFTLKVLQILREHQAKATFFVLGDCVKKNAWVLPKIVAEGHELGNHTYRHRLLSAMSKELQEKEVSETQGLIRDAIGFEPQLFRPPFGAYRNTTKEVLKDHGVHTIVLWSVDPEDWKNRDTEKIITSITNKLQNGSIIVCHDIYKTTVNALPTLLTELKAVGYEFVTVSQLCGLASTNLIRSVPVPVPVPVLSPAVVNTNQPSAVIPAAPAHP